MPPFTGADDLSTAELLRRVRVFEAIGFGAMLVLLTADLAVTYHEQGTVSGWAAGELLAAIGVAFLTLVMTNRLFRRIQILEGMVSICMYCKRVKHDGSWLSVERYVSQRSAATFSHGLCPECYTREYALPEGTGRHRL